MNKIDKDRLDFVKGRIKFAEPMSRHTTFRIGGPADALIVPDAEADLLNILRYARENAIEVFLLGGGSKILVADNGIRGFVVLLSGPAFRYLQFNKDTADLGCGLRTSELINEAASRGLGGCEFLAGVPGTIGGAIMMNAGWPEVAIGNHVEEITVIKGLDTVKLRKNDLKFSYRSSGLEGLILISAKLKLEKKNKDVIAKELKNNIEKKEKAQDLSRPSAGSIFLNPSDKVPAWKLVELSGLKGFTVGDAMVSEKHANFIINRGRATAADVRGLIEEIQKKVFKDHQIMLKLEVKFIGEF